MWQKMMLREKSAHETTHPPTCCNATTNARSSGESKIACSSFAAAVAASLSTWADRKQYIRGVLGHGTPGMCKILSSTPHLMQYLLCCMFFHSYYLCFTFICAWVGRICVRTKREPRLSAKTRRCSNKTTIYVPCAPCLLSSDRMRLSCFFNCL